MSELDEMLESIKEAAPAIAKINQEADEIKRDVGTIEAALAHEQLHVNAEVYLAVKALKIDGSTATAANLLTTDSIYLVYSRHKSHGWCIQLKTDGGQPLVPFQEAPRGLRLLSKRLLPMLVKQIHGEISLQKRMIQPNAETPTPPPGR